jgi:hypothetical protein
MHSREFYEMMANYWPTPVAIKHGHSRAGPFFSATGPWKSEPAHRVKAYFLFIVLLFDTCLTAGGALPLR